MLKGNKSNTFSIVFICHLLHSATKPFLLDNYKYKKLCVKQLALSKDNIIQKVLVSQEKRLSYSFLSPVLLCHYLRFPLPIFNSRCSRHPI
ncbi:exported hypothetical protein [uncultured Dysgonomonas sp.]|uniref:Uncharacterized protein n=1 Tax=uncultured Dysgonomonas sp. TaxID=206096 RepID=A0A212K8P7_9BACT|nr:exported hypothetical protein [uncultured Dysgonomonas sp.]